MTFSPEPHASKLHFRSISLDLTWWLRYGFAGGAYAAARFGAGVVLK